MKKEHTTKFRPQLLVNSEKRRDAVVLGKKKNHFGFTSNTETTNTNTSNTTDTNWNWGRSLASIFESVSNGVVGGIREANTHTTNENSNTSLSGDISITKRNSAITAAVIVAVLVVVLLVVWAVKRKK